MENHVLLCLFLHGWKSSNSGKRFPQPPKAFSFLCEKRTGECIPRHTETVCRYPCVMIFTHTDKR